MYVTLYVYAYTGNPDLFPELITIQSKIAHYLKNCLQHLFLSSKCYDENRCVKFNKIMMSQIYAHKCVINPASETHTIPRFNAARCNGKENVFAASDP